MLKCLSNEKTNLVICQDYTMSPTDFGCILFNYLNVVFLCTPLTKGAQFDQFDRPITLRSQVSTYNNIIIIDIQTKPLTLLLNKCTVINVGLSSLLEMYIFNCLTRV